jgi:copper chaperone
MSATHTGEDLGLSDKNSGCACCDASGKAADVISSETSGLINTKLGVTGMTCGHCVSSVTEELNAVDGVETVDVQLHVGGVSTVTVSSSGPLDPAALRVAIDEAGYALVEV